MTNSEWGPQGFIEADIPNCSGKQFVITGANSGIGLEAARLLGKAGGEVWLLCRNPEKAEHALDELRAAAPAGTFHTVACDLTSLNSVQSAADTLRHRIESIDALIANAGIMFVPKRQLTEDGFEQHFGVNVIGHYALFARLGDLVIRSGGRCVSISSIAHHYGRTIPFDDLTMARSYKAARAYAISKTANLCLAIELQRRLDLARTDAISLAAHPGWSATNLQSTGPGPISSAVLKPLNAMFAQPATKGALPTVLAAVAPQAKPGRFYGPTGFGEMRGPVREAEIKPWASNPETGAKLWSVCESLTGLPWAIAEGN